MESNDHTDNTNYKKVNWYLFFDLYQVSINILDLTNDHSIIILVGDTPSYLAPLLEAKRKIFHLAISNKAFGCFVPPFGENNSNYNIYQKHEHIYVPSAENLNSYFNFLNNKTMTKSYVGEHWNDIVLVDASSGQSIHGVSIFLNRYVGHIIFETDKINCDNIRGAKPLKFIRLVNKYMPRVSNVDSSMARDYFYDMRHNFYHSNYRPDLIICIGLAFFRYMYQFMIDELYPRLVPFYSVNMWDKSPDQNKNSEMELALANINKLRDLLKVYVETKKNIISDHSKIVTIVRSTDPIYSKKNLSGLKNFLNEINLLVLKEKHENYFNIFQDQVQT